jgi:hypothetical protein
MAATNGNEYSIPKTDVHAHSVCSVTHEQGIVVRFAVELYVEQTRGLQNLHPRFESGRRLFDTITTPASRTRVRSRRGAAAFCE